MSELFYRVGGLKFHHRIVKILPYNAPVRKHGLSIGFLTITAHVVRIVQPPPIEEAGCAGHKGWVGEEEIGFYPVYHKT